jgi:ubiquinone/menaquinone biosynthesis C-methylase UbiE
MTKPPEYVLGQSADAARRLEIQDAHFADVSEKLLDDLALRPGDRVVELGCGAGSFSRRVIRRLGKGGVLVGVDSSPGLLDQAGRGVADAGAARFEPVLADLAQPGQWLHGADAVVARTVLHHVPMVEFFLGRLRATLRPGTRLGFIEPDFRTPLTRVAYQEATGRPELRCLLMWGLAINQLYQVNRLSPAVGATLAKSLDLAGCRIVHSFWQECRSDSLMIENMLMFYDEVRERLNALHIMTAAEIDEQQRQLRGVVADHLPPVWAVHSVIAET